jgi:molybdopterin-binding protein
MDTGRLDRGTGAGPATVEGASVARVMTQQAPDHESPVAQSARNRFPGIVIRVERDGVMALVEIQAGPHRVTSLMSRASADELGLEPGVLATAVVKSTSVIVQRKEDS